VAVNFAKVPKKRPKLSAKNIRERDGHRCQYTGQLLKPDEGSLDHVLPRSRGGADTWENRHLFVKAITTRFEQYVTELRDKSNSERRQQFVTAWKLVHPN
jgi:5-methylcytosine-specific restriction endonuclease McrA